MIDHRRHIAPDDATNPWYEDGTVDYERVQGSNPAGGKPYPKMLYKHGGEEEYHGVPCSTVIVNDEDEEESVRDDGWRATPALAKKAALPDGERRTPSRLPPAPKESVA